MGDDSTNSGDIIESNDPAKSIDDSTKSGDLVESNDLAESSDDLDSGHEYDFDYRHPEREQKDLI
jgi:hypothetical protein